MTRSQKIGIIVLFILSICGVIYTAFNFHTAFPEVAVPINFDKETSSAKCDSILFQFGANPEKFRETIVMDESSAKLFIDKEFGGDTIPMIHTEEKIPVWKWSKRYFVPLQKEEYHVSVRPDDGRLAAFIHTIPETLSGADISADSAQIVADSVLISLGYNLDDFELKEASSEKRPNRRDHWFTYEKKGWFLGDAKFWIEVGIWGNKPGKFRVLLHIPESWWRDYTKGRSSNILYQTVDQFFSAIFILAMLIYLLLAYRRKGLAWKFGAAFALVTFLAGVAMHLNLLPLAISGYDTADSFNGFLILQITIAIMQGAVVGMIAFIAGVAGERIYREFLPDFDYLPYLFSPAGWRSKSFRNSVIAGYLFAIAHLGFVVFFYTLGKNIGFWSPTQSNYTNLLSTYLPWLFPLAIGLMASISEDFMFRLFGVPFISKITRSKVIGVIIPALIWSFLHSAYPQEPGWVRGVEIGIIGISAGWLFLRYSIAANLVWHFAFDAGLTAFMIIQQGNVIDSVLSIIVVLLPVIMIGLGYILRREQSPVKNADKIPPELPKAEVKEAMHIPIGYKHVSSPKKIILWILAIIGLAVIILAPSYPSQTTSITRTEAISLSLKFLTRHDVEIDSFKTVAWLRKAPSAKELRYVYEQKGWQAIDSLYGDNKWEPIYFWMVRFFIPETKNEYNVSLSPGGEIISYTHYLEESDRGAIIEQDSALVLAERLLHEFSIREILNWELIEKRTVNHPNRDDHFFTWQSQDSIGQAHPRVGISILGDEAVFNAHFLKCPEEWERKDTKKTPITIALGFLPLIIMAIAFLLIIVSFGVSVAKKRTSFKAILWSFVIAAIVSAINQINSYSTFARNYFTTWPYNYFLISGIVQILLMTIVIGVAYAVSVGAFFGTEYRRRLSAKIPFRETIIVSSALAVILIGISSFLRWIEISFSLPVLDPQLSTPTDFDMFLPGLALLTHLSKILLGVIPALFVIYIAVKKRLDSTGKIFLLVIIVAFIGGIAEQRTFAQAFWGIANISAIAIAGWFIITKILKDNVPLFISTAILFFGLTKSLELLLHSGNSFYLINGIISSVMTLFLWLLSAWFFNPKKIKIIE